MAARRVVAQIPHHGKPDMLGSQRRALPDDASRQPFSNLTGYIPTWAALFLKKPGFFPFCCL